jgi:hypothetical protein
MIDSSAVTIIQAMFAVVMVLVALLAGLITIGLERQKRELAGMRKEIEGWVSADLELKRAATAQSVKVEDPLRWMSRVATRATGAETKLVSIQNSHHEEPDYILALDEAGNRHYFSATTPDGLRRYRSPSRAPWASRLQRAAPRHPLVPPPAESRSFRLSNLNCGLVFDLEAAQVWKQQVKEDLVMNELWLYILTGNKEN